MNKQTKITIIIAVFNGAKTLQRCIDSVAEQTYLNKELIIMDGGSTDATVDILNANDDKIAYWETQPDRGIYHAWNKALEYANGAWICFLGADDYWAKSSSLDALIRVGNGRNLDLISAKAAIIDDAGNVLRTRGDPWDWERMKRWQCIAHPGMLCRRTLFDTFGKFNEEYQIAGDYDFLLRLGANTVTGYLDKAVVYMGNAGVSHTRIKDVFSETQKIQEHHPEIGYIRSKMNYYIALSKSYMKKVLCVH